MQHSIARVLAEQNVGQLEQRYERCVTQFLTATERPQSSKQVRALHGAVRTALRAYEAHPRRGDPAHAAPQRLADLYRIQQRVDEAQQALVDKVRNAWVRFGPARIELHLKKKWRAQLKASLPGPP